MKKILFVVFILFTATNLFSQNFSYGIVFGTSYIDGAVQKSSGRITSEAPEKPNIHFGAFADYQFSNRFGVKLNMQYNKSFENYEFYLGGYNYVHDTFNLNSLQFIPHLKFDVKTEYGKGFYLLAGPRISVVLSAKDQAGNDVTDFYKGTNFGTQFGFGFTIAKMFAVELLGDYGLSDISESEPMEIKTAGAYLNLTFNVESIINK